MDQAKQRSSGIAITAHEEGGRKEESIGERVDICGKRGRRVVVVVCSGRRRRRTAEGKVK